MQEKVFQQGRLSLSGEIRFYQSFEDKHRKWAANKSTTAEKSYAQHRARGIMHNIQSHPQTISHQLVIFLINKTDTVYSNDIVAYLFELSILLALLPVPMNWDAMNVIAAIA